jgi:hypothetical protein
MKYLALAVAAASGALLAVRGFTGPFSLVHSPMNVEGIFALSWIAMLLLHNAPSPAGPKSFNIPLAGGLCGVAAAGFAFFLGFPLLADDYSHIWNSHHATATVLWAHFTVPEEDHFFRPVGYLCYALDALWAGYHPFTWRGSNLVLHLINCVLVFRLCIELGFRRFAAFGGALLFAIHGSRPEAVTWISARFDLLALLFGLGCVLSVMRGARLWLSLALLLAALFSKESAYVVPFVIAAVLFYQGKSWRAIGVTLRPLLVLEAAAFGYRTWILKGIGGYSDAAGKPVIFHFGLASSLKAVFLRFWAAMIFPLNWTGGLPPSVAVSLAFAIAALIYLAWRGADRRKALLGIAIAVICSLPVQQFLSIGPDLEKSRVIYMASAGLAVLFAALFERARWIAAASVILFQLVALENNLLVWKRTGYIAERACRTGAEALRSDPRPLAALGLPNVLDGVYFLHTGYPECVRFQLPESAGRIFITPKPGAQSFIWNETLKILERVP